MDDITFLALEAHRWWRQTVEACLNRKRKRKEEEEEEEEERDIPAMTSGPWKFSSG